MEAKKFSLSLTPDFIVSTLPSYVQENSDLLVKDLVFGASSIEHLSIQTGIKTTGRINILSADPVLQDGAGCGFTPENSLELSQRSIATALIKVNEEICPDTLLGKYAEYLVRIPEPQREFCPYEDYVLRALRDAIRYKIEKLIWQGDTSSANPDLKWIDGLVTIADADANAIPVTITSGISYYNAIKEVVAAFPADLLRRNDVKIFVSPEFFVNYTLALVEKNYYHYPAEPVDVVNFPGTNIKIVKAEGLTGAKKVFASYSANLFYGCDVENAAEQFKVEYDNQHETFFVKCRWNSGVNYAFSDRVVIGTYTTLV